MLYNITLEIASAIYMLITCLFLRFRYNGRSEVNKEFRKMVYLALAVNVLDVITGVTISYSRQVPLWANMALNTAYFMGSAMLGYQLLRYMITYIWPQLNRHTASKVLLGVHCVYLFLLLSNLGNRTIFFFGEDGVYTHGPLYMLVYMVPFCYAAGCLVVVFLRRRELELTRKIFCTLFILIGVSGCMLQALLLPHILLGVFTITLGVQLMLFTLETPDYPKLIQTMEELHVTKARAEEAQQLAQEADRAKTTFLSNMSHEFRTPINAVLGYNGMILREAEEKQTRIWSGNVQAAGRTLLSMVNDILDFSAMMDGKLQIEEGPYSTLSLLQDMVLYAEHNTGEKGLQFRYQIGENLPQKLFGDEVRMTQILNNLLSNAIKYTQKGSVTLGMSWERTESGAGTVSMWVSDTGIGIREEDLHRISESFSRFDEKQTRNIQGVGIGLSMVSKLVDQMGGRMEIKSEYGKGSTFRVCLPQKIVDGAPIGVVDFGSSSAALKTEWDVDHFTTRDVRILVADDHQMNLDLFAGMLRGTGIQMDTAENGEAALRRLERQRYDLIFLDHMMPVLDGVETLREIRGRKLAEGTPVIVATANAVSGSKEQYLEDGFDDYLSKPVRGKYLYELLLRYLPEEKVTVESVGAQLGEAIGLGIPDNGESVGSGLLERLDFLDTKTGMTYCDSEDFYEEMLSSYRKSGKYQEIADAYEKQDWDQYRVLVHALKSTSLAIGAIEMSERAKELEKAAKEGDVAFIREHHRSGMAQYQTLLGQIQEALSPQEQEAQTDAPQAMLQDSLHLMHVLVVDDDEMNLRMAEKMLRGKFRVSCASSGEATLAFLEKEVPDMILLDLHMPDMDGFEVMDRLRQREECRNIPVIFLTADNDRDMELQGFQRGAMDFIAKPFIADIMIQRISRILELDTLQKRLQKEVRRQTRKAEERREKVERLSLQMVRALANTIDAKDRYTNGHSTRVAEYAREIAKRMGKTEREQSDIYYMGLLHDIGKIGIPDFIINKPDKLTDNEYKIIMTHPVIGADILKHISEMPGIEIGARWHHERYDGKGYPDGLRGEEIPEVARIIGVADAYDAMTSNRSYRSILPQRVVRQEIVEARGTQLDARIADIMLQMIDEDKNYQMQDGTKRLDN